MKDIRNQRLIDGELVLIALENKLVYGVIFKETVYYISLNDLMTLTAETSRLTKISVPTGVEVSIRKEILQYVANCSSDRVAIEKASKLCGKKKFEPNTLVQSMANCVAMPMSAKSNFKFTSRDEDSVKYVKMYTREVADYIKSISGKDVVVSVTNNEIVVALVRD